MMLRPTASALAFVLAAAAAGAACPGSPTPASTEGPYYKAGSPERAVLREASPGSTGRRLVLTGVVYDDQCRPLAGAWIDFWQADGQGRYDNSGFGFRGHQLTDSEGRYNLDTTVPGGYTGRTPHIHVKVRAPGAPAGRTLTTQLYLPGEERNRRDSIFRPALVVSVQDQADGALRAAFDFKLPR
jgi:protocatechuate 3,4-dioxygenase beta subunit